MINFTNVLVSEFERLDKNLDYMLENTEMLEKALMARDPRNRRAPGIIV